MKAKRFLYSTLVWSAFPLMLSLHACHKEEVVPGSTPYILLENYAASNTAKIPLTNSRLDSEESFEQLFISTPAIVGNTGVPTPIDFTKQSVIAVISPETDRVTSLSPVSLIKATNGDLTFTYRKTVGDKQSYTSVPILGIAINKQETGKITLKELN